LKGISRDIYTSKKQTDKKIEGTPVLTITVDLFVFDTSRDGASKGHKLQGKVGLFGPDAVRLDSCLFVRRGNFFPLSFRERPVLSPEHRRRAEGVRVRVSL
jgi:hypothetical protein